MSAAAEFSIPGLTLGVIGGGQLGRMLAEAASPLGIDVIVADPTPECPAAPVVREQIVGDFDDPETVRAVAERVDILTFEIELAGPDVLDAASAEAGIPVHPSPDTLRLIEDKLGQNRALQDAGVRVPAFRPVDSRADLEAAVDEFGYPVMLKARRGGYDGRGNFLVESAADVEWALESAPGKMLVEEFVPFDRELSVIGVKGRRETATFPAGENIHEEEILRETIVPARTTDAVRERAQAVAADVLDLMDGRGVYGIELFERDGEILVNEIAPRPHNSGHYTIEGGVTSQFEQHVRAVAGLPLGSTALRDPVVMANVLGDVDEPYPVAGETDATDGTAARLCGVERVLETPGANVHWYGKREVRPLRKMGHLTVLPIDEDRDASDATENAGVNERGESIVPNALLARARELADGVTFEPEHHVDGATARASESRTKTDENALVRDPDSEPEP